VPVTFSLRIPRSSTRFKFQFLTRWYISGDDGGRFNTCYILDPIFHRRRRDFAGLQLIEFGH
jgi:hypothetical protein